MLLKSLAALGFAHFLPGFFVAKLLGLGRTREERLVIAAVLGGPVAALLYLAVLLTGVDSLFWLSSSLLSLGAILLPARTRLTLEWPRATVVGLAAVIVAVLTPYLLTTGSLYRVDRAGELLLDRALQRDALFHLGVARSLETSYPPRLLSVSGAPISYHSGYHLQLALWARVFGIEPEDGLARLGAVWHLALYVLGAYLLSRRLFERESTRILCVDSRSGLGLRLRLLLPARRRLVEPHLHGLGAGLDFPREPASRGPSACFRRARPPSRLL